MSGYNFAEWRTLVSSRKKLFQILEAFKDESLEVPKYVCAPCSNCKRLHPGYPGLLPCQGESHIHYGGLVELIVNAMAKMEKPMIRFEET